jgi:hypothetical protein
MARKGDKDDGRAVGRRAPRGHPNDSHRERRDRDGAACLRAAFDYQQRGWSVVAFCPPDHAGVGDRHAERCDSPGKAPWGPWKEFQERRATGPELRRKWADNPGLNVGVALGPVSGLIGADVDGPGARPSWRSWPAATCRPPWSSPAAGPKVADGSCTPSRRA